MAVAQRVRQFFGALTAQVAPHEYVVAERYLNAAQLALFYAMPVNDRRHALNVLYRLVDGGHQEPELLRAALLHDVAKSRSGAGIATRVIVVLLARVDRRLVDLVGRPSGLRWRRAVYTYWHHATIGAELATAAGCDAQTVRLIASHSGPPADALSRALESADEAS